MDTLTHLTIGACVGEAFAGRRLGKRAMLWGATIHSLPDIDFLNAFWFSTPRALLAHRGFTHSFLFCAMICPLLTIAANRLTPSSNISRRQWCVFFVSLLLLHDGLDALNNYGVGWFEPFNEARIAFNLIYVADPFFTIWPLVAFLALLYLKQDYKRRKIWYTAGLGISCFYLLYCYKHKLVMDLSVKALLKEQNIRYTRYFTTPAPLQNWLWYVTAGTDSGYYTGYRSVFDRKQHLALTYFPRNTHLLNSTKYQKDIGRLLQFSQQFYTVELRKDTTVFNDLRFGQITGWQNPNAGFAFHYFIQYPEQNKLVVQRGRFADWNWQATKSLYRRIKGD
ncbi:metal-dependent hydrolase [Mucilaginibacter rubeus]|uniref:Metal-dependent hydrolase n=1 Tax=Mucilaginibacter rubeus TaxID=2027860 RepID=A0AAE6JE23_9SPHI|nr:MULTISPECIES: metal-dependent hydrolase [Mucilaginibacter]QEM03593.1 metal-dependent hydrolase [Mucilaginibacter rubeus]QEM16204.1 metal-dependent hydrolase [Mucilaginibacter gossypii]QTE41038.1 metal-dependent hydrolase [Mucilaginibacter rubeus]QTE47641.1 metal-dependent hydrolase [Mucilaginibacter rubeus]QTE59033.1 metal-dependent hydrolase [Mucilaginibacter rubeus]